MKKIVVIVNGLPGKMAQAVARAVSNSEDMILLPHSLTGPDITIKTIIVNGMLIELFSPHEKSFTNIEQADVVIDFTHPSAVADNVKFYVDNKIPFVMGTTGGDSDFIKQQVKDAGINAVLAPNMAKEIVIFQAMMEFAAEKFPGAFKGFSLEVTESHQKTKADTSGTAKAVIASFNQLGIPFTVDQIEKKRAEPDYEALGIPPEFWNGHGWHAYTLKKSDGSVFLQFTHNVNGRQPYIEGVLDAVRYLYMVEDCLLSFGETHSMIDVLDGSLEAYQEMMRK